MDSYEAFKSFLDADEIHYRETTFSDGDRAILIPQRIKGNRIEVAVIFLKVKIKIMIFGLGTVEDEAKRAECYKLFNKINMEYAFFKMFLRSGGEISVEGDFSIELTDGELQTKELMHFVAAELYLVNEVYPELMRILWL